MLGVEPARDHSLRIRSGCKDRRDADERPHTIDGPSRLDDAAAHSIGALIVGAGSDHNPLGKPELRRQDRWYRADDTPRGDRIRQLRAVQTRECQQSR